MRITICLLLFTILNVARADDSLSVGNEAYAKCDLDKAIAAYRVAHKDDPKNYEATWRLARAINDQATLMKRSAQQKALYLESQSLAQEAVKLNPEDSKGYLFLSIAEGNVALYEGGKKKVELGVDVKKQAQKAIELNPKEDLAYHVLGIWNREMATLNAFLRTFAEWLYGKFPPASLDVAVENFQKAIEIDNTAIAHHVELGVTYGTMKKWAEAKAQFQKALDLPKQYPADGNYQKQAKDELEKLKRKT
ncbi:MAG: hypothetical protein EXS18_01655 [Verrucomicrobiae bacterium]|nr:hypothetical protein [Verrucomicrobiae bacterium]